MRSEWLESMECPYCLGDFRVVSELQAGDSGEIRYGLVACRCFEFPIVDGVLLLSLSKGYGGAEEAIQPYAPLQTAALDFLGQGDVDGLERWIRRHVPVLAELMFGELNYLSFAHEQHNRLLPPISEHLSTMADYELIDPTGFQWMLKPVTLDAIKDLEVSVPWYLSRLSSRVNTLLRAELATVPLRGRLLSLCCGQGIFELHARGLLRESTDVLSVDGQILNLFVVKKFVHPRGTFICHDVQFPLPFKDAVFDGCHGSTFLPEIPAQATVLKQALRVVRDDGWFLMHRVWAGAYNRVDTSRHYRICQNHFDRIEDYGDLWQRVSAGRPVAWHRYGDDGPDGGVFEWQRHPMPPVEDGQEPPPGSDWASFMVGDTSSAGSGPAPFTEADRACLRLHPFYDASPGADGLLRLEASKAGLAQGLEPKQTIQRSQLESRDAWGQLFALGLLIVVPESSGPALGLTIPELLSLSA